jgi:hypothetical protein
MDFIAVRMRKMPAIGESILDREEPPKDLIPGRLA